MYVSSSAGLAHDLPIRALEDPSGGPDTDFNIAAATWWLVTRTVMSWGSELGPVNFFTS